jgi:hypothetical protein
MRAPTRRSTSVRSATLMKRLILPAVVIMASIACGRDDFPTAPSGSGVSDRSAATHTSAARAANNDKVSLCHRTGEKGFMLISVAAPAVAAHLDHGDGRPGAPVHSQPDRVFAADCAVVAQTTEVRLDQSAWGFPGEHRQASAITASDSVAQTFTVGLTGSLVRIDLGIFRGTATTTSDVILNVVRANTGLSTFDLTGSLVQVVIPFSTIPVCPEFCSSPPYVSVMLPTPLAVNSGDSLAIVLRRPGGSTYPDWVLWSEAYNLSGGVNYTGGESYHSSGLPLNKDHRFQTYVALGRE